MGKITSWIIFQKKGSYQVKQNESKLIRTK